MSARQLLVSRPTDRQEDTSVGINSIELAVVGCAALFALTFFFLIPTFPNFDTYYHLVWGREIFAGLKPTFTAHLAPTEHPLYLAFATLLTLFGESADRIFVLVDLLIFVALLWGVYRLGCFTFGRWPGLAAAVFVGSSYSIITYAVRAYVDIPFLALVVWAAAFEAQRPRRGYLPMSLLVAAGLLRPEAWLLAGIYWLWCWPKYKWLNWFLLGGLVLVGPVVWTTVDFLVTGDPLFSLHSTSELVDTLGRKRSLGAIPGTLFPYLAATIKPPVALAAAIGLPLSLKYLGWRKALIPLVLVSCGAITFIATGIAGLSLLARYLTVPAVALALFAGYALFGFTNLPIGALRKGWQHISLIAIVLLGSVFCFYQIRTMNSLANQIRSGREIHDDLRAILHSKQVQSARHCGPVTLPNYRLVPDTRWILNASRLEVGSRSVARRLYGVELFFTTHPSLRTYGFADGISARVNGPDPGYIPIIRKGQLRAYMHCPR